MSQPWTDPATTPRARRLEALQSGMRAVPISFAIVGAQKAATTSLYRMLVRHPNIVGGPQKELQYFANERLDWPDPDLSDYARPTRRPREKIAGDASPVYLFWPHALERMRAHRPDMRLIATFRDPIERAFSQWAMERRRRGEAMPGPREAIATFDLGPLPAEIPPGAKLRQHSLFTRGLYGAQLERGLGLFPRDQWLLLDFRRVISDHVAVLDECTAHLGLEKFATYPDLQHRNQGSEPDRHAAEPLTGDDLKRLVDVYAEDLPLFERLSGLDTSHWPTSRIIAGTLDVEEFAEKLNGKLGLRSA